MTDNKRFTVDDGLENVLCWEINDKENKDMTCAECAKLLNELHEENEALKSSNLEYEDALGRLEEENERLENKIELLELENGQLKGRLMLYEEQIKSDVE